MGGANGPETRCNASLWQGREASDYSRPEGILRSFAGTFGQAWRPAKSSLGSKNLGSKKPGPFPPGLFVINTGNGQAAGL